jgi:hypothetical protein
LKSFDPRSAPIRGSALPLFRNPSSWSLSVPEFDAKKPAEACRPVPILTDIFGTSAPELDAEEIRRAGGI